MFILKKKKKNLQDKYFAINLKLLFGFAAPILNVSNIKIWHSDIPLQQKFRTFQQQRDDVLFQQT